MKVFQKISELTGVSVDYINKQLFSIICKRWYLLYQSKKVSASNNELKDKLLEISGIKNNKHSI